MKELLSRRMLDKWLILAGVACMAICLSWVSAYLMMTVGLSLMMNSGKTSFLEEFLVIVIVLTPVPAVMAVVFATLRFAITRRWLTISAIALLPLWGAMLLGVLWYFFATYHMML
ncbi:MULTISPECIES: hypothetical protein [unclassified Saccharibacter]|uniref:hypothetical protein n=1 Tax=unclassified Saccharibacter TaxID=2648722 RepID=UPI0013230BBE|nr:MULTISPECIES: hypothetical protein [unclassified Saccharibacter]MXV35134.1 hypothetical protein [Saccharibacter sp. EH611]MXV57319.1 hypothetical protein [Saccharibacter sp. EH70]MXV64820.1 hypothetical protein [Saccharibacter sp. EH60]